MIMNIYNLVDLYYYKRKCQIEIGEEELQKQFCYNVENDIPFMCGRISGTEAYCLRMVEFKYHNKYEHACKQLCQWSGFFPQNINLLPEFCNVYHYAIQEIDYLYTLGTPGETYLAKRYLKKNSKIVAYPRSWYGEFPFTKCLKQKNVLVISSISKAIESQYEIRDKLFEDADIRLPEFNLKTFQAIQTLGDTSDERFEDWFEALKYMETEITKIDFDIAVIGCGAYGLPLASFIKKMGKSAVHIGGDIQMMFGIYGDRWLHDEKYTRQINSYWIRNTPNVKDYKSIEGGCYW